MQSAKVRAEAASALSRSIDAGFHWRARPAPERMPAGIAGLELPRGAMTEICGPASSGRTGVLLAALAAATGREEACALVDACDAFDPASAMSAGIDLERLLWIRCGGRVDRALQAADLLAHGGGFGLLALDLGDLGSDVPRRIPLSCWYRLLRAVERTPAALVVVERSASAKSCAALVLEMKRERIAWSGRLLRGILAAAERRKPAGAANAAGQAAGEAYVRVHLQAAS